MRIGRRWGGPGPFFLLAVAASSAGARGETVTLPAAASIVGAAPFYDIFTAVGAGSLETGNAHCVVESDNLERPLFTYAAVIDCATSDPILVLGAQDVPAPGAPQIVTISVRAWDFSPGGPVSAPLVLTAGVSYTLVFRNIDPPGTQSPRHGFSGVSELGLPATGDISPGRDFVIPLFLPQPYQRGIYPFACTQNGCGGDPEQHAGMLGILKIE